MTAVTTDAPLLDHTDPATARPLPAAIHAARADVARIVGEMLAVPESALPGVWPWVGGGDGEEVRYGFYRVYELLEAAEVAAAGVMRRASRDGGRAAAIVGASTAARWDLHGLVAPLTVAELDADPGDDEWSIRLTLGHIVGGQRSYGWSTAWWQAQEFALDDPRLPQRTGGDDSFWEGLPDEATVECAGSLEEIRARLDAITDLSAERLAGIADDAVGQGARWGGFAVPLSFRLGRWSSHIREHTIQIEKTLVMIGRSPTEPERLVRLALAAYGRAEQVVFGQPEADAAAEVIRTAVGEALETIASARAAADART